MISSMKARAESTSLHGSVKVLLERCASIPQLKGNLILKKKPEGVVIAILGISAGFTGT